MCIVEFMIGVIAGFVAGWIAFPEPRGDTQFMGARHGLGASHDTSHAVTSCSTWKMLKISHDHAVTRLGVFQRTGRMHRDRCCGV